MSKTGRRISAAVLLALLVVVPFWDWKLGSLLWMCAWLVFIFQNLYSGRGWNLGQKDEQDESREK